MALEAILTHKASEVADRKRARPLDRFEGDLSPSDRSLYAALSRARTGFILECKKASPSQGVIRSDFDPEAIAATYARFADGISVLTDQRFFGGSLGNIAKVRAQAMAPILLKDFVIEPYQVFEARSVGADAVLLMLSVLDDHVYRECAAVAERLGLDALTEVHTEQELERALGLGARIIGINNRDLKTLAVDLKQTRRLGPRVPSDRLIVCESGVSSHRDVSGFRNLVDGFLIGTALMRRSDLAAACKEVIYGPVKVCGLTREVDARAAEAAGATFGGLIFAKKSPRYIDVERAQAICRLAPLRFVGVFVDESIETVARLAKRLGLAAVQLHGKESAADISTLRRQLAPSCDVWKAVSVRDRIPDIAAFFDAGAGRVVLDAYSAGARGGTGTVFDWRLLEGRSLERVVLAGGLTADNVEGADQLGAGMLDVSSGVETSPGIKSEERLAQFFGALRGSGRITQ